MFGAARILQAIARDSILPIGFFAKGTKKGDEPVRAVVLTYVIVNAVHYVGKDVNSISQILTDFFLTACAFVNLSQALLALAKAPNYRPTFQYATWWSSTIGFLLAVSLMWYLNPQHAAITCGLWTSIFLYITLTCEEKPWGDVMQAILFRFLVGRLKRLVQRRDHAKFWRSSVLLLCQDTDVPLLTFCHHITKDGLFMVGTGLVDAEARTDEEVPLGRGGTRGISAYEVPWRPTRRLTQSMLPNQESRAGAARATWLWLIEHAQLNAFINVGVGSSLLGIFRSMIASAGLGGLVPNTVVIPYRDRRHPRPPAEYVGRINEQLDDRLLDSANHKALSKPCKNPSKCAICNYPGAYNSTLPMTDVDYVRLMNQVIGLEKNLMVVRESGKLDGLFHGIRERHKLMPSTIDCWIVGDWDWKMLEQG